MAQKVTINGNTRNNTMCHKNNNSNYTFLNSKIWNILKYTYSMRRKTTLTLEYL